MSESTHTDSGEPLVGPQGAGMTGIDGDGDWWKNAPLYARPRVLLIRPLVSVASMAPQIVGT